jgi:hypothetical protein
MLTAEKTDENQDPQEEEVDEVISPMKFKSNPAIASATSRVAARSSAL